VFQGKVIYQLIDQYIEWRDELKRKAEQQRFEQVVMPAKIRILPNCVFRQSNPAIVGVRVLGGVLRSGVDLIKTDGKKSRADQNDAAPPGNDSGSAGRA
jgi:translation initiation factor 5B